MAVQHAQSQTNQHLTCKFVGAQIKGVPGHASPVTASKVLYGELNEEPLPFLTMQGPDISNVPRVSVDLRTTPLK